MESSNQLPSSSTTPAYTETPLTFDGPEGFPLAGILCEPAVHAQLSTAAATDSSSSSTRPFTSRQCAILCHGFASHKDGFHFPAIAQHLAQQLGMSSLRFDYTGNMDSPGPFRFASFMEEVRQMAAAKQFLEQQHNKQVVLLLGHSRGAINATLYSGQAAITLPTPQHQHQQQQQHAAPRPQPSQAQHADQQQHPQLPPQQQQGQPVPEPHPTGGSSCGGRSSGSGGGWSHQIPLVVLVAGRYDLTLNMRQRYGPDVLQQLREGGPVKQKTRRDGDGHEIHWELDVEGMAERFALDVAGACNTISSLPDNIRPKVLIMHGACDPICEASDAANLAQHIEGSELVEVEGADHWFKGRQRQLLDAMTTFAVRAGREKGLCPRAEH